MILVRTVGQQNRKSVGDTKKDVGKRILIRDQGVMEITEVGSKLKKLKKTHFILKLISVVFVLK